MTATATVLWEASGRPTPPDIDDTIVTGVCSVTGEPGPVWPWRDVFSSNFALLENCAHPHTAQVGAAAAWAVKVWGPVRSSRSRWKDMNIVGSAVIDGEIVNFERFGELPPVDDPAAVVIVPTTRKSHAWIHARPGAWACDTGAVNVDAWLQAPIDRLVQARRDGLGEAEAREPSPRPSITKRLDMDAEALLVLWDDLEPLRARPMLLDMLLLLTRQPK